MGATVQTHGDEKARQRAAYEGLIAENQAVLLRAARRMCRGDDDRAQDLVQDALIRGYSAFLEGRFVEGTNGRAWLLRILTNGFLNDQQRRSKWEAGSDVETALEQAGASTVASGAGDTENPELALLHQTLDEPLERALDSLPDEMRLCVLLVDVQGLEYAYAAAALRIPIGTVRSRLARARLKLQDLLVDYARAHGRA